MAERIKSQKLRYMVETMKPQNLDMWQREETVEL